MLMKYGVEVAKRFDLRALERVFCAGELLNPPVWSWLAEEVLEGKVPVLDHWWQTETGVPVIGNPYGLGALPVKPGSAGIPLPGMSVREGDSVVHTLPPGATGTMCITRTFPTMMDRLLGVIDRTDAT